LDRTKIFSIVLAIVFLVYALLGTQSVQQLNTRGWGDKI
jgi:hypothetical protein